MPARILDGTAIAAEIRAQVTSDVAFHNAHHGQIKLVAVLVGADPAGQIYADRQRHLAVKTGVQYELIELPDDVAQRDVLAVIDRLNADATVTGVIVQMPLPDHIDAATVQWRIDPFKDVEGVNPANIGLVFYDTPIIAPCTALAVVEALRHSDCEIRGAHAVVVGQSRIVGKPITMFLLHQEATVTGCHVATRELAYHTRQADILVVAVGRPGLVPGGFIKPGAVVIDVGINSIQAPGPDGAMVRKTVGDVCFDEAVAVASVITPVPGGIGPMTVAMLMRNTVEAARKQMERQRRGA